MHVNTDQRKDLRRIAHHLKPIVIIAERGLTPSVMNEIERALADHELIKVRITTNDRAARSATAAEICVAHAAALIAQIGKIAVIYRHNPAAKPHLSNLQRPPPAAKSTTVISPPTLKTTIGPAAKAGLSKPSRPNEPTRKRKASRQLRPR